ncbi:MAG: PIN domain-containing protein [Chloroflexota bacterium]|nr:MAG: PIN domain-containing protein [Chloroflexota bacterium]
MSTVIVDASVWVSRYVEEDTHHRISQLYLERHFRSGGIVVAPVILLAQLAGPVARQTGDRTLAHDAYRKLLKLPTFRVVPIDHRIGVAAAKLAADLGLRGADAVYIALAQALNITLITWDEQQRERGAAAAATVMPQL